jgi:hypothetical protein
MAGVYGRNFTASELREVTAFYRTPLGQKFLDKQAAITQETVTMGQEFGRSIASDLQGRVIEEMRRRNLQP